MAVATTANVFRRPWRGHSAPGLPTEVWYSQASSTADASGGANSIRLLLKLSAENTISEFFNLEDLSLQITNGSGVTVVTMRSVNMDHLFGTTVAIDRFWNITFQDGIADGAAPPGVLTRPIFLGRPNNVALQSELRFDMSNVNGTLIRVTASGYVWGPRSVLVDGGLQRPGNSLFGT